MAKGYDMHQAYQAQLPGCVGACRSTRHPEVNGPTPNFPDGG